MLRIGICDDETEARDALRFQLERVLKEDSEKIVYEFTSGESAARWFRSHPGEIDLLFLDVEMEGKNGMETAREIRGFNQNVILVFVTGYTDYVFEGYRVSALDYVVKPARAERLLDILKRVRGILEREKEQMFLFKNTDGTFRIPYKSIAYFYSEKRKTILVSGGKEYSFYGRLDEAAAQVGSRFVRIHQRYLVNADKVEHIGRDEISVGGKTLPVSRSMKAEAMAQLAASMLTGGREWKNEAL